MACTLFAANRCSCLPVTTTSILEYERVKYNRWNDVMGMLSSDMEVWTFLFVHHHQCCYFLGALVKDRLQITMSTKVFWSSLKQLLANKQMTWNLIRVCTSFTLFHLYFMKNTSSLKPAAINSIIIALTHFKKKVQMGENGRKAIGTSATNQVNWQLVSNMHGHQKSTLNRQSFQK